MKDDSDKDIEQTTIPAEASQRSSPAESAGLSGFSPPAREFVDRRFARANGRTRANPPIRALWDKHHEVIRLIVLGKTNVEIARLLGCTKENISTIRNEPLVQAQVASLTSQADAEIVDITKRIAEIAPKAIDKLEQVLDSTETNAALQVTVARDLLDRAGHGAVKQHQVVSTHLSKEDLSEIKNRARSSGFVSRKESSEQDSRIVEVLDL